VWAGTGTVVIMELLRLIDTFLSLIKAALCYLQIVKRTDKLAGFYVLPRR